MTCARQRPLWLTGPQYWNRGNARIIVIMLNEVGADCSTMSAAYKAETQGFWGPENLRGDLRVGNAEYLHRQVTGSVSMSVPE